MAGDQTPLYAMILIAAIDAFGFYPTYRKSWSKPDEETVSVYLMSGTMYLFGLMALDRYTVITVLYPASLVLSNRGFTLYIIIRRRTMRHAV